MGATWPSGAVYTLTYIYWRLYAPRTYRDSAVTILLLLFFLSFPANCRSLACVRKCSLYLVQFFLSPSLYLKCDEQVTAQFRRTRACLANTTAQTDTWRRFILALAHIVGIHAINLERFRAMPAYGLYVFAVLLSSRERGAQSLFRSGRPDYFFECEI